MAQRRRQADKNGEQYRIFQLAEDGAPNTAGIAARLPVKNPESNRRNDGNLKK